MDYQISHSDFQQILSCVQETTVRRTLALLGVLPDRVSRNRAEKMLGGPARLRNYEKQGDIKGIPLGNGETSKIEYSVERLLELRMSEKIVIHKSGNRE
ncbi:MAG: hypothetical protein LBT04_05795 [Prevotellaceae bacterium]|jgi:hypothetical protein|nr:hypothetical protein [Prevotellaceae bacterium]